MRKPLANRTVHNRPRSTLNLEININAHQLMDKYLPWGIEAILSGSVFGFVCNVEFTYQVVEI